MSGKVYFCPLINDDCNPRCVFNNNEGRKCWLFFIAQELWYDWLADKKETGKVRSTTEIKLIFQTKDSQLGRVRLREDEDSYYLDVERRDLHFSKKGEFLGSGYWAGEEPLPWWKELDEIEKKEEEEDETK